jgi:oligopeptide/dipeptide ABC transporter ATP-binding protein
VAIPLLEVRNLAVSYPSTSSVPVLAVRQISFRIFPGEVFALVGETGCGKTSAALSILGLHGSRTKIESGQVLFHERDLLTLDEKQWRGIRGRLIGTVFQDPMGALNPVHTVGRQIVDALEAHLKISRKEAVEEACRLLAEVGIPEPKRSFERYPQEFSGGMCQRVCIAIAVCHHPELLVADEPTSALDPGLKAQVMRLLLERSRSSGSSIFLISHDLALIAGIADTVAVMYHGRIVESGPAAEVIANPAHPYTRGLIQSQPGESHHPELNPVRPIPGLPPAAGEEFPGCAFAPRCSLADARCRIELPHLEKIGEARSTACFNPGSLDPGRPRIANVQCPTRNVQF